MKLYNKLGVVALSLAFALTSCSKDNEPVASVQDQGKTEASQFAGLSMLAGVNYQIGEELGDDTPSEARAVVAHTTGDLNANTDIPTLYVNDGSLKVNWAVYAKSGTSISNVNYGAVTTKHSSYQQNTNMGTGYSILDASNNQVAEGRKIAVTVEGATDRDFSAGRYAHMVIGGTMRSSTSDELKVSQAFGFNSSDTPNAGDKLVLATNNSKLTMPFPLTTSIQQINPQLTIGTTANKFQDKKVNWVKMTNNFNARGTVLGFRLLNETGYKIKVKSLVILNHNNLGTPFSTKGYFSPASSNSTLKFVAEYNTENIERTYTLRSGSTDHFDLNAAAKTDGRFYFWGYPVAPTKELYVKVVYQSYNSAGTLDAGDQNSIIQKIAVPGGGSWADGTYYRVNLKVKSPYPTYANPISYMAPTCFDANGIIEEGGGETIRATDLVADNNLSSIINRPTTGTTVGYYTWMQGIELVQRNSVTYTDDGGAKGPNMKRWFSIIPNLVMDLNSFGSQSNFNEKVRVGTQEITMSSDYKRSGNTIYALRYKGHNSTYTGDNYLSAWSYSKGSNGELIIKSVFVKDKSVDDIIRDAGTIFSHPKTITRVLPAYGGVEYKVSWGVNIAPTTIVGKGVSAIYWLQDRYAPNGEAAWTGRFVFENNTIKYDELENNHKFYPIRPFLNNPRP